MDQKPAVQKPVTSLRKLANLIRERWPEYVVEIAVIIFSISISFALDEWKDRQQKQELEQLYLKELARDIDADIRQLNGIIAETKQVAQKANGLIKLSQQESQPVYSQFVNDVRFIFKRPRFVAQDATFSDLKSSGNLQTMRSFPLKNALFDY
jgi:type II secretory pathway pseudopilin PulG